VADAKNESEKLVASNKKARHEYFIEEVYEAGIVLTGTEIQSVRRGKVSLIDSYVEVKQGESYLINAHISEYDFGNIFNHEPRRTRKLLLHKMQIRKLESKIREKGMTVVPLRMYLKRGLAKLEIGLARGKKLYDKRDDIAKRDVARDIDRAIKERRKGLD